MDSLIPLLAEPLLGHPAWLWVVFAAIVAALLAFDLGVLNHDDHEIGIGESLRLSAGYIGAGLAFGAWIWWYLGAESGLAWLTGYVIEKSLSLDNVFVIAVIFGFFAVPRRYQHRVLFWGVFGALAMRALMIGVGAALVHQFAWLMYFFGALLVATGIKLWRDAGRVPDMAQNPLLKLLARHLRIAPAIEKNAFVTRRVDPTTGRLQRFATPLLLALCLIEFADLLFAVDSIPAIFSVTTDPFLAYTSNVFALLGLRALYFSLAATIARFKYLKPALALVLVFIGAKIFAVELFGKIPAAVSLAVTFGLIAGGVLVSLWKNHSSKLRTLAGGGKLRRQTGHQPLI